VDLGGLAEERVDIAFITRRSDDGPALSLRVRRSEIDDAVWIDPRDVRPPPPHNLMPRDAVVQLLGGDRKRTCEPWELVECVADGGEEWTVNDPLKPVSS
jgi:hypothetical protein